MKFFLRFYCHLFLAAFLAVGATAHADTVTFAFTATGYSVERGTSINATGTLTTVADPTILGAFDVISIYGNVNGDSITGLLPCATYDPNNPCDSPDHGISYDNLLYPGGTGVFGLVFLDDGIGFTIAGDSYYFKFADASSHFSVYESSYPHDEGILVKFDVSPIPEPGSFILLGTGLLGVAGTIRRRITSRLKAA